MGHILAQKEDRKKDSEIEREDNKNIVRWFNIGKHQNCAKYETKSFQLQFKIQII
jgi:hypothetical protein